MSLIISFLLQWVIFLLFYSWWLFFWFNYFANMCRIGHQILKSFYQILKLDNICVDVIKQQDKIFLKSETCFRLSPHCVDFLSTEIRRLHICSLYDFTGRCIWRRICNTAFASKKNKFFVCFLISIYHSIIINIHDNLWNKIEVRLLKHCFRFFYPVTWSILLVLPLPSKQMMIMVMLMMGNILRQDLWNYEDWQNYNWSLNSLPNNVCVW